MRWSPERGLAHPTFSAYHSVEHEPVCTPVPEDVCVSLFVCCVMLVGVFRRRAHSGAVESNGVQ